MSFWYSTGILDCDFNLIIPRFWLDSESFEKTDCTVVTLVAMVRVNFLEARMNSGKEAKGVLPSISSLPWPYFTPLHLHLSSYTSHGSISLTFNFSHHLFILCPVPTLICQPPLLFSSNLHILIFHFLGHYTIHLFLSLLCPSVSFCYFLSLSVSVSIPFYDCSPIWIVVPCIATGLFLSRRCLGAGECVHRAIVSVFKTHKSWIHYVDKVPQTQISLFACFSICLEELQFVPCIVLWIT